MADGQDEKVGVPDSDELEIRSVSVTDGFVKDQIAYYHVRVSQGGTVWIVEKRYSKFELLHTRINSTYPHKELPLLPPKKIKLFQSHVDENFIEERRALLDNYLRKLVSIAEIGKSQEVVNFLNNDKIDVPQQEQKRAPREHNPDDFPDDQEITDISIPSTRTMSDHVLYQIDVSNQRKRKTFSKWTVLKRFGQFHVMDEKVRMDLGSKLDVIEAMPQRPNRKAKIWHDHMDVDFIEERRVLLENYLTKLLSISEVATNKHFLSFLGVNMGDEE